MTNSECFDSLIRAIGYLVDGSCCDPNGAETEEDLAIRIIRAAKDAYPWEESGRGDILCAEQWNTDETIEDSWLTWAMVNKPKTVPLVWKFQRRKKDG